MPVIPPVREAGAAARVVTRPQFREVPTTLGAIGQVFGQLGQQSGALSDRLIRQERANAAAAFQADLVRRTTEAQRQSDAAETASEARRIWEQQAGAIAQEAQAEAERLGMEGELAPVVTNHFARTGLAMQRRVATRLDRETAARLDALGSATEDRLAGANSTAEYNSALEEFRAAATRLGAGATGITPAMVDAAVSEVATEGATRRAVAMLKGASAANDPAALQALRTSLLDEDQHPNLPLDERTALAETAGNLEDQLADRAWVESQRRETILARQRQKLHTNTMQGFMDRLSEGANVTDQEIAQAVGSGELDPTLANFVRRFRDGTAESRSDLFVYNDHRSQAEFGILTDAEVFTAVEAGAYDMATGRRLLDTNVVSERQGGIMRDAQVEGTRDLLQQVIVGAVGDDPTQTFFAMWNASDTERRLANRATIAYDSAIREAVAQGQPIDTINPRRIAGGILEDIGFRPPRPSIPVLPDADLSFLQSRTPKEIEEVVVPGLQEMVAETQDRGERQRRRDQLAAARNYLDRLRQWEAGNETIDMLLQAVPRGASAPDRPLSTRGLP